MLRLLEKRQGMGPLDDYWYRPFPWLRGSGPIKIDPDGAMGISAWYNAIAIIAGTMGSLPLKLYRRNGDAREPVTNDPRHWLLFRSPNPWQTAFEWREMAQGHLLTRGNHYSRKVRNRLGEVTALVPLHPDRVTVVVRDGEIRYEVQGRSGGETLGPDDVLHLRGLGSDGLVGYSVASLAAQSLGYTLQLESHGTNMMENRARPGGVLTTDAILKPEHRKQLEQAFQEMTTGGNAGRTPVIDGGLKWQQVGFSAEDAQFLESRKFQVTDIARWTNLPPHFLKDLERSTYSNIEQQSLEFVVHTMRPWAERWEQRLDVAFLEESEREELFFKFNLEALLRGDQASRAAFYQALFNMAALSPNDIRSKEDMNPVEGGDQRFVQLNLIPLEMAGDPMAALDESTVRMLRLAAIRKKYPNLQGPAPEDEYDEAWDAALDEHAERSADSMVLPNFKRKLLELLRDEGIDGSDFTQSVKLEMRAERSARARLRLRQIHQRLMTEAAGRLVRREVQDLRRILDAVEDGDTSEFLRRMDIWAEGLPETVRGIMGPLLAAYIDLVAEAAAEEVEIEDLDEERVAAWRASYVDGLARAHTTETTGKLRDTMTVAEGDPFANARAMLDRWDDQRGAAIALREVVTAGGGAATMVYAMVGMGAVWRNSGQENCPYCAMLEGRTVQAGGRFLEAGDTLDPGGGVEPLTVGRAVGHPSAHTGCDCFVQAHRGA